VLDSVGVPGVEDPEGGEGEGEAEGKPSLVNPGVPALMISG
jgi:hypothetical protein